MSLETILVLKVAFCEGHFPLYQCTRSSSHLRQSKSAIGGFRFPRSRSVPRYNYGPDRDQLRSQVTVCRDVVYNPLQCLCGINEDHRHRVALRQTFAGPFTRYGLHSQTFRQSGITRAPFGRATRGASTGGGDGEQHKMSL